MSEAWESGYCEGAKEARKELEAELAAAQATIAEMARHYTLMTFHLRRGDFKREHIAREAIAQADRILAKALQPHASLVAKIKADAVREAATHVGSGMYCAELVEYADRIERGEVK